MLCRATNLQARLLTRANAASFAKKNVARFGECLPFQLYLSLLPIVCTLSLLLRSENHRFFLLPFLWSAST